MKYGFTGMRMLPEWTGTFIDEFAFSPLQLFRPLLSTFCFLLFLITFNKPRLFLGILLFLEKLIPSFIQHLEQVAQSPRRELFDSYLFQIYL
jgi:hypothetical protein